MTSESRSIWGILLAAGAGARFGGGKQFATFRSGERLVDRAAAAMAPLCDGMVLVLPAGMAWDGAPVDATVTGGTTRTGSVRRGLAAVPDEAEVVLVHQAAHPLATRALFERVIRGLAEGVAAAVPGLRPADVVRRVEAGYLSQDVGRDDLAMIQTPGAFRADVLRAVYASASQPSALEETGMLMAAGEKVALVEGDPRNIHVATREDLAMAEDLLAGLHR